MKDTKARQPRRMRSTTGPLALLLMAALLAVPAAATENLAAVVKVEGEVQCQLEADGPWSPLVLGRVLGDGDKVRTGRDGSVALLFLDDKSLLKLAEETEVSFRATREGRTVSKRIWMGTGQLLYPTPLDPAADLLIPAGAPTIAPTTYEYALFGLEDPTVGDAAIDAVRSMDMVVNWVAWCTYDALVLLHPYTDGGYYAPDADLVVMLVMC